MDHLATFQKLFVGVGLPRTSEEADAFIDQFEVRVSELAAVKPDLAHNFVPGFYIRSILMKAGSVVTSKIHMTRHPYFVEHGVVDVYSFNDGVERIIGPHWGMTTPGTRRVLLVHEDTLWTTFHATELTDPAEIEEAILMPRTNPLLQCPTSQSLAP